MHRLSGAVDGPVSIDFRTPYQTARPVIVVAVAAIQARTGLVAIRIGKDAAVAGDSLCLEDILTLRIRLAIRCFLLVVTHTFLDTQMGTGDGLSRCSTDHHIAHTLTCRQALGNGVDIRHVVQPTNHAGGWHRLELHHIHAHGQPLQGDGILKDLVGLLSDIRMLLVDDDIRQQGLDSLIALIIHGRLVDIAIGVHAPDFHRERREVAQALQLDRLRLLRQDHGLVIGHIVLRIGHLGLLVAQFVHPGPTAPPCQYILDIIVATGRPVIVIASHIPIVLNGYLTSLGQVAIGLEEGVDFLRRGISVDLGRRNTGRTAVTCLHIVVVQGFILLKFIAHDTQQVVVEDPGIDTPDDEGCIILILHASQLPTESRCQFGLVHRHLQRTVILTDAVEHGLIDDLEYIVLRLFAPLADTVQSRAQRVGGNLRHRLGTLQFGLQQLTVVPALLGLLHDLLQYVIRRLGQVFLLCLRYFLPKGRIRLSEQKQWHHHCYD